VAGTFFILFELSYQVLPRHPVCLYMEMFNLLNAGVLDI